MYIGSMTQCLRLRETHRALIVNMPCFNLEFVFICGQGSTGTLHGHAYLCYLDRQLKYFIHIIFVVFQRTVMKFLWCTYLCHSE